MAAYLIVDQLEVTDPDTMKKYSAGIGATLANAFGRYDYDFALAITIVIVGVILISEGISGMIRKRIG